MKNIPAHMFTWSKTGLTGTSEASDLCFGLGEWPLEICVTGERENHIFSRKKFHTDPEGELHLVTYTSSTSPFTLNIYND